MRHTFSRSLDPHGKKGTYFTPQHADQRLCVLLILLAPFEPLFKLIMHLTRGDRHVLRGASVTGWAARFLPLDLNGLGNHGGTRERPSPDT